MKSRLVHKASGSKFVYNPLTLDFKRVTKNQQLALKRKHPIRLEPLVSKSFKTLYSIKFLIFNIKTYYSYIDLIINLMHF